jgi:signal transduction histidine kinase
VSIRVLALMPRSIAGQITLLVLVAVALMHGALTLSFVLGRTHGRIDEPPARSLATLVQVLDHLPRDARPAAVAAMAETNPNLHIALGAPAGFPSHQEPLLRPLEILQERLGPEFRLSALEAQAARPSQPLQVLIRLRDGESVTASMPPFRRPSPGVSGAIIATIVFVALNVGLLSFWAARSLTTPLTRFVQAAETFSLDQDPAPLPNQGPDEIRRAARALNRLRERIRRMVEERTRMVAAVSHDLRTPITRMRLRAEFVDDDAAREAMLRDLDQMSAMVNTSLSYLRDGRTAQQCSLVDIAILLQTVVNNFVDMGQDVAYDGPDHLSGIVRADDLYRAASNLVENAMKFATKAVVRLTPVGTGEVDIDVIDNGPGIPATERDALMEPFARGDASRNLNQAGSGFGLGLSIARAIAEAQGGTLSLHDVEPHGLLARIHLPVGRSPHGRAKVE